MSMSMFLEEDKLKICQTLSQVSDENVIHKYLKSN